MNEILVAFFSHPTTQGAVIVLALAFAYGAIRITSSGTRVAVAAEAMRSEMVGMRQDRILDRDISRNEHDKTRKEVQVLREDILRDRANGIAPHDPERRRSRPDKL